MAQGQYLRLKTACKLETSNYLRKTSIQLKSYWKSGKKKCLPRPHVLQEADPVVLAVLPVVAHLAGLPADHSLNIEDFL